MLDNKQNPSYWFIASVITSMIIAVIMVVEFFIPRQPAQIHVPPVPERKPIEIKFEKDDDGVHVIVRDENGKEKTEKYPTGYKPNPVETKRYLDSLEKPGIREAATQLFEGKVPGAALNGVFLYRPLYKQYREKFGKEWVVGKQAIGDCFVAGTLVMTGDGKKLRRIENIQIGEHVRTHLHNSKMVTGKIDKPFKGELITIRVVDGRQITCTADHQFLKDNKWVKASDLRMGDKLTLSYWDFFNQNVISKQEEIVRYKRNKENNGIRVYCIEVEDDHSFIADGYSVHNCVSWGWGHGITISQAINAELGESSEFDLAATEVLYGGSRQVGGMLGGGDGSYGSAAAKFVREYGVLWRRNYQFCDLTTYSGRRAQEFGAYGFIGKVSTDNKKLATDEVRKFPVLSTALVVTTEELEAAIKSGYPVPICSGQGFTSKRDKDGFCQASGSWPHCMVVISWRGGNRKGFLILNSWGPTWVSGPKFPDDQPEGSFWCSYDTMASILRGKDSFAVSGLAGFPFRDLVNSDWVSLQPSNESQYVLSP